MGDVAHQRPPTLEYMTQVAKVADSFGFDGALTPTGTACEDSWIVCSALIRETQHLKFMVAFRPGFVSPTLAAQQAATFQRYSGGRLLLNIVTGGNDTEQKRFGDWLPHDERYERTGEFLEILGEIEVILFFPMKLHPIHKAQEVGVARGLKKVGRIHG